jgi:adenylate cyclase
MRFLRLQTLIPILVLAAAALFALREPYFVVALRESVFDTYQRLRPRVYQPVPVRIVDIDEASLTRLGQWPWPRSRLAELVERLQAMGAAAIVFDMLFAEPDRTSPSQWPNLWRDRPPVPEGWPDRLEDFDQTFATALAGAPAVTGFALVSQPGGMPPARPAGFAYVGGDPRPFVPAYPGAVNSLPVLEAAAAGNGALNVGIAAGGVIRRVPLLLALGDQLYPSLVAEAIRVAQGADTYVVKTAGAAGEMSVGGTETGITHVRIGGYAVPTDARGAVWVAYTPPEPRRYVSAWTVLDGSADREALHGAIVLVGSTAAGLQDLHATPLAVALSGVGIHTQVIEQILLGIHLNRPDWAKGAEVLLMVGLAALLLLLGGRIGAMWTAVIGILATVAAFVASWYAFREQRILLDPLFPAAAVLVTYIVFSLIRTLHTEREQRWIRKAFASYMSPKLVKQLVDNPQELRLTGERRELSFLFTDLEGFTSLIEQAEPTQIVPVINAYLDGMIRIAFDHDGTVDKVIGDALHVMFGAPVADPDHARRAVACAMAIDAFAQDFRLRQQGAGIPFGETRIGVNSGSAIVGNFGGELKFDYTAHGDSINTAARLEGANKYLGTRVLVSEHTVALCPGFTGRPAGTLMLKGRSRPIRVFEPVPRDADAVRAAAYREAFARLEAGAPDAEPAFGDVVARWPDDRLAAYHLARLRKGETGPLIVFADK